MAYDLNKAVLIKAEYNENEAWKGRAKKIMHLERVSIDRLLHEFDLSDQNGEFKVTYYGVNMMFYQNTAVIPAKTILKRLEGTAIEAEFRARNIQITQDATPTGVFSALLDAGVLPIRRVVTPEYAREYLTYVLAADVDPKRDKGELKKIGVVRKSYIEFVIDERNSSAYPEEMWLLISEAHEDALLALYLFYYGHKWVVIDYVASLFKGACKHISSLIADKLLAGNHEIVKLESITPASHMCYLASYLRGYKYVVLSFNENDVGCSLVDMSSKDMWWNLNTDEEAEDRIDIYTHVHMTFIRDDNTLIKLTEGADADNTIANIFGHDDSTIHVYVEPTVGVTSVVYAFLSSKTHVARRVIHMSADGLRARYPNKRQKLSKAEESEEDD